MQENSFKTHTSHSCSRYFFVVNLSNVKKLFHAQWCRGKKKLDAETFFFISPSTYHSESEIFNLIHVILSAVSSVVWPGNLWFGRSFSLFQSESFFSRKMFIKIVMFFTFFLVRSENFSELKHAKNADFKLYFSISLQLTCSASSTLTPIGRLKKTSATITSNKRIFFDGLKKKQGWNWVFFAPSRSWVKISGWRNWCCLLSCKVKKCFKKYLWIQVDQEENIGKSF